MRRYLLALLSLSLLFVAIPAPAHAATNDISNRGLYISPLRSYLSVNAGDSLVRSFRVANLTEKPMTVTTSLEAFSVADFAYDYQFSKPKNDWIELVDKQFTLKPLEGREVPYRLNIPKNAPAGGQYYTLYASTDLGDTGLEGTVRAATLLYLTVNGTLTRTSQIVKSSLFPIVVGTQIPYSLDVKNTGNIHYFAYFSAKVDGLFYHREPTGTSQLLMPDKIRQIKNTIPSPFIPGVYKVTYGYSPDQGDAVYKTSYVVVLPPWFVILATIIAVIVIRITARRRATHITSTSTKAS
jgi:hypothetical protein